MPKVYVRPLEGQGIALLERMGGIIDCREEFHIVKYQNDTEGDAKVTLLECGGERYELIHFEFQPKDAPIQVR